MRNDASTQDSASEGPGWTRATSGLRNRAEVRPASTDATRLLAALKQMDERATRDHKVPVPTLTVRPRPPL
jgi:hypothetical protein